MTDDELRVRIIEYLRENGPTRYPIILHECADDLGQFARVMEDVETDRVGNGHLRLRGM